MNVPSYPAIDEQFYQLSKPSSFPSPRLLFWNSALADTLNISEHLLNGNEGKAAVFSGQQRFAEFSPIALAYAGHQFGNFVPSLGDGRAHLIGEVSDSYGMNKELQLKGSGPTPFSRGGDGMCALGPAIREFLMSEALHYLGVPTTRSLSVVTTGSQVMRNSLEAGAVVSRVASSHVRVGTFQYFSARQQLEQLEKLVNFTLQTYGLNHEEIADLSRSERSLMLLRQAIDKHITMICEWMRIGFIHGVMNTDNAPLTGETIDFGPCAMMGVYSPDTVYSSIDRNGRYAFANQPDMAQWNMTRLAECLIPLVDSDTEKSIALLTEILENFAERFRDQYQNMMRKKLGLLDIREGDQDLVGSILNNMQKQKVDYTLFFDALSDSVEHNRFAILESMEESVTPWRKRVLNQSSSVEEIQDSMRSANPVLIPRNHIIEQTIAACSESMSAEPASRLLEAFTTPYDPAHRSSDFYDAAQDDDIGYRTYCGT